MSEKMFMQVTLHVTEAQAIALREMFRYWNTLGNIGASRHVTFFVDGDGDMCPDAQVTIFGHARYLEDEDLKKAVVNDRDGDRTYDYDPIGWALWNRYERQKEERVVQEAENESGSKQIHGQT